MAIRALVPYAILGVIGAGGAFAGFSTSNTAVTADAVATPPTTVAVVTPSTGPVIVHAALERTVLPVDANDVFARRLAIASSTSDFLPVGLE